MTTFNKLKSPKLYAGEDILIYRSVLQSNLTDFTVSGLDGNNEKEYKVEFVWNGGGANWATMQLNGDATAANYRLQGMGSIGNANYAAYDVSHAGITINYGANAGDVSETKIFAQAGYKMATTLTSGLGTTKIVENSAIWLNNTDNLTSIKFVALTSTNTRSATPTMTSNTAPSGVASASTELNTDRLAWKAFNKTNVDANDSWASNGTLPAWLKYDFGSGNAKVITYLKILTTNYATYPYAPGAWVFQGSNDDSNWTDLASATNSTNTANTYIVNQAITNSTAYRYYRFYITTACANPYVSIGEMEMTETYTTAGYFNTGTEVRIYAKKSGA